SLIKLMEKILKLKTVHFIDKPTVENLEIALAKVKTPFLLKFKADPLTLIQKERNGKRNLFLANSSDQRKSPTFELDGKFSLSSLDPHTGKLVENPTGITFDGKTTRININLDPYQSIFLVEK